ncbi:MAG: hypothetical protein AAGA96_04470 [Verrucomicrobiota bacterium]
MPRWILVTIVIVAFGLLRSPFETSLNTRLIESRLLLPPPGQRALDQMSQSALMGTLGGLRSLVSSFLTLEAFDHFSNKEWDELKQSYQIITALEPRDETHWVSVIWHLGINATANMQIDTTLPEFERDRRFNEYAFQAIELAERGLEQLPESVQIRKQLSEVYREKLKDDCATARIYGEIMHLDGAPSYARRFHGYFLARCPGKEAAAYDFLIALYDEGEHNHLPTLIHEVKKLEDMLDVPFMVRILNLHPDEERALKESSRPRRSRGGIMIP